jgi:hypothetical protein
MTRDVPYGEAISTLTWAALATRPVITFAGTASFFVATLGPLSWRPSTGRPATSLLRTGKLAAY